MNRKDNNVSVYGCWTHQERVGTAIVYVGSDVYVGSEFGRELNRLKGWSIIYSCQRCFIQVLNIS